MGWGVARGVGCEREGASRRSGCVARRRGRGGRGAGREGEGEGDPPGPDKPPTPTNNPTLPQRAYAGRVTSPEAESLPADPAPEEPSQGAPSAAKPAAEPPADAPGPADAAPTDAAPADPPPRPEERLEKAVRAAEQALIEFEIAVETFRVEVENFSRLHHQKLGPMYTRLDELDAQIAEAKAARTGDAEDLRLAREARARVMPMPGVEELFHGWIDSEGLSPRAPPCSTTSRCARRSGCVPARTPAGSTGTWSARPTPIWRRGGRADASGRVHRPGQPRVHPR